MQIGNYRLLHPLGEGGMGQVWLAEHTALGTQAVVKSLHPSYAQIEAVRLRFYTEARLLSELDHPAIVRLYDFVIEEGVPYLIMEYVQGTPLDKYIAQKGTLSLEETLTILRPIWNALAYIHEKGIIHRDIKPANIMVLPQGGAKLIDFGIAKALDMDLHLTKTGTQVGTALYMAPEQIQGQPVSPATDLYGMGLVLYECLIGQYPWTWQGLTAFQIYQKLLTEPPPIPAWCPEAWKAFFEKALAKDPTHRFHTAKEMQNAWESLAFSPQVSEVQSPPSKYTLANESLATKDTLHSTGPKSSAPASPPTGSSTSDKRTATTTLSYLFGVALGIVLIVMGFAVRNYLRNKRLQEEKETLSAQIRQALEAELQAYAARQQGTFEWGPLPQRLYPIRGNLRLSCYHSYTTTTTQSETYEESCYLSFIPLGPPRGVRKITRYYQITHECTRSGEALIEYEYVPSQDKLRLIHIDLPDPTCQSTSRRLSHEEKEDCHEPGFENLNESESSSSSSEENEESEEENW